MKGLIVLAHGSRVAASNDEIRQIARALTARVADRYGWGAAAFLELAEPSLGAALAMAAAAGCREVVVLPYFLAAGSHVSRDLPALVREQQRVHPGLEIRLHDHVGKLPGVLDLLARSV